MDSLLENAAYNIREAIEKRAEISKNIQLLDEVGVNTSSYKSEITALDSKIAKWQNALKKRGVNI